MSIDRLCLGTANFGLDDYPPGRGHHKVPRDEAISLIRAAYAAGVRAFDTAYAYGHGLAEDILAEALEGRPAHVTTKCPAAIVYQIAGWTVLQHNPLVGQMNPAADGASVYTPAEAWASMAEGHKHLQVPYWLMDYSFREVMENAKAAGVTVYARQPYGRGQVPCKEALWFALESPADYIVFGCANQEQLDQTLAWAEMTRPTSLLPSVCTRR